MWKFTMLHPICFAPSSPNLQTSLYWNQKNRIIPLQVHVKLLQTSKNLIRFKSFCNMFHNFRPQQLCLIFNACVLKMCSFLTTRLASIFSIVTIKTNTYEYESVISSKFSSNITNKKVMEHIFIDYVHTIMKCHNNFLHSHHFLEF
jgi:hypothetical protein